MPEFISLFIEELNRKKEKINNLFFKKDIKDRSFFINFIETIWHKIPESLQSNNHKIFAIDASQRTLSFSLGPYLLLTQGLAIGTEGYEKATISLDPIPASISENQLGWIRDLIMQNIEAKLAIEIIEEITPPFILFIDGSILSRISYLLRYINLIEEELYKDLALNALKTTIDLILKSKKKNIELISISKSSRNTFFFQILSIDHPELKEELPYIPIDAEFLNIISWEPGYSTPLLIGAEMGLGHSQRDLIEKDPNLQILLKDIPAFITFYVRLIPRDQILRIDIPNYLVGDSTTLLQVNYHWEKDVNIDNILAILKENCINSQIYQTPLYLVDKIVRIKKTPDLERYIMILKKEFPGILELDRSQRRFF